MANYQERREKMSTAKKTLSVITAVAIFAIAALMTMCVTQVASAAEMNGNTATELVSFIGTGWNLGNTLDAIGGGNSPSSETSWGNPKTTKAMIDAVKAQGFSAVRVPVSWGNHTTGDNFTIDSKWLARVKEVVDYCIDNDMYVILNIHHDTSTQYYYPSSEYKERSVKFVNSIWTQVAKYFKDYDQKLIFETLNEPRLAGTGDEWWFDVNYPNNAVRDSISAINALNQTAVDAIRAAGGKNTDRCIMVPGYGASIDGCTTSTFKLPDDSTPNRLIVSVHAYTPYNFALNANGTAEFTNDLKNEVDYLYSTIKSHFIDKGVPAIIGETSASNKNNAAERVKWAQYYMGKSAEYGVPCMLWDNNAFNGSDKGECHGHLNRSTLGWYDKAFVDAVIKYGKQSESPESGLSTVKVFKVKSKTNISANLQWDKNTSASGYELQKYNGSNWETIKTFTSNANTSFNVTGLKASTTFKFRLRAYKTIDNVKEYSAFTYLDVNTRPYTTTGMKCSSKTNVSANLQWNKNISANGYVLDKYDGSKWVTIKTFTSNANTSFNVTGLKASTTFKFRLRAYKTIGKVKEYSAFTYLNVNTRPYTTTGMKCSSKTNVSANLQWNKNRSADGYVLDKYDGKKWVTIKTFTSNANTSFNVTGLKASTTLKFRLRAYKNFGSVKEYSAFTYLNVNTRPYTTTGFKMKSATKNAITLQWNKNISASGYCIEKWNGSKWVQIKRYTSNANVTYTATGLKANTAYKFRIRAYKTIGNVNEYSAYSAIVTARTKK
ncbi:Endoglucanase A precursor [[Eubacterium] siraeum]|uniref:Endoglucanase A n=1 Tax=[Eubacterium] siraeum TaxID=39492 RepID=A0A174ZA34_9FIRM|nr:Endoglucanase A precursor [[Eubacterium] siraeum]